MSKFEVLVRRVEISQHPNADLIELARVDDYRCVVIKGQLQSGQLAVYIPTSAIVPEPLLAELGLVGKLAGPQHNRVKAIRLRGELSEGLVYRPETWPAHWTAGHDVTAELDIVEWEPPIPIHMAGAVEAAPKGTIFTGYTDIENVKRYPNVLQPGEPVAITEKLHGTCLCVGVFRDDVATRRVVSSLGMARGHKTLREDPANVYWRAAVQFDLFAALERFMAEAELDQAMLFGEVLGVQDLRYGFSGGQVGFRLFDVLPPAGYLDHDALVQVAERLGLPMVPVLYRGPYDPELLGRLSSGPSTLAGHMREGVVVRPLSERSEPELGRVILKSISPDYLLRTGGTELH